MQSILFFLAGQGMLHTINAVLEFGKMTVTLGTQWQRQTCWQHYSIVLALQPGKEQARPCILSAASATIVPCLCHAGKRAGATAGKASTRFANQLDKAVACLVDTAQVWLRNI